jgi:predicted RNA-binding Zn-ribbon protein involved in translation (DUF1610 family)
VLAAFALFANVSTSEQGPPHHSGGPFFVNGAAMKVEHCPKCNSESVYDQWQNGRKLSQRCYDCGWLGPSRIPEQKEIPISREVRTGQFNGWHYEICDRYGHTMVLSRYYSKEEDARRELAKDMAHGATDADAGPYTAVLWRPTVTVQGEVVRQ